MSSGAGCCAFSSNGTGWTVTGPEHGDDKSLTLDSDNVTKWSDVTVEEGRLGRYLWAVASVLVVDDDATVRAVLTDYLVASGMEATSCADGLAAVEVVCRDPPDLILLDVMLPGVDGLEVFRRLRQSGRTMPIIMLTALGDEQDRVRGLEMGGG